MEGMTLKGGHKRPTDQGVGLTQKGVEKYRRQNPGSKLQTAVTTPPSKLKLVQRQLQETQEALCEKQRLDRRSGASKRGDVGIVDTYLLCTVAQTSTCLDQHERSESLYSTDEESR